jgi:hypothetical protein
MCVLTAASSLLQGVLPEGALPPQTLALLMVQLPSADAGMPLHPARLPGLGDRVASLML